MEKIPHRRRLFYLVMGCLSLFMSLSIFTHVMTEWFDFGLISYANDIPFPHPLLKGFHWVLGACFWFGIGTLGTLWIYRFFRGTEIEWKSKER